MLVLHVIIFVLYMARHSLNCVTYVLQQTLCFFTCSKYVKLRWYCVGHVTEISYLALDRKKKCLTFLFVRFNYFCWLFLIFFFFQIESMTKTIYKEFTQGRNRLLESCFFSTIFFFFIPMILGGLRWSESSWIRFLLQWLLQRYILAFVPLDARSCVILGRWLEELCESE